MTETGLLISKIEHLINGKVITLVKINRDDQNCDNLFFVSIKLSFNKKIVIPPKVFVEIESIDFKKKVISAIINSKLLENNGNDQP